MMVWGDEHAHSLSAALRALAIAAIIAGASVARAQPDPNTQEPKRPKVALVLSGGGALGIAHVGVIQELERAGIRHDLVVGTTFISMTTMTNAAMPPTTENCSHVPRRSGEAALLNGLITGKAALGDRADACALCAQSDPCEGRAADAPALRFRGRCYLADADSSAGPRRC